MSEDLLSEATRALRETDDASEFEARRARARVLTGLHQTRVRRRTRLVFLLPIAATFVAVGAWASSNNNARHALQSLELWLAPPPVQTTVNKHANPNASTRANEHDVRAPSPVAPLASPVDTSALLPAPISAPPPPALAPAPQRSAAPRPEASDPTLNLYRAAHTSHFVDHDPARALAGWDAYLAAAPNGPFAPEARYNRALSLVRLGRNGEARSALEPFANGAYGSYRKAEASLLLERLGE